MMIQSTLCILQSSVGNPFVICKKTQKIKKVLECSTQTSKASIFFVLFVFCYLFLCYSMNE